MNAFVKAAIAKDGIYVVAKKIGVNSQTLVRYVGGQRLYGPSAERIEKWGNSKGRWKPPSTTTKNDKARFAAKAKAKAERKAIRAARKARKAERPAAVKKTAKKPVKAVRTPKKTKRPTAVKASKVKKSTPKPASKPKAKGPKKATPPKASTSPPPPVAVDDSETEAAE